MSHPQKSQSLTPVVLSIAGSDNSGGAGLQADLKTFTTCGVYGTTAVTSVVAENPGRVLNITPIPPERVADQIRLVFDSFPVSAMKTGLLASSEIIFAIEKELESALSRGIPLVVDPVMVATSGKVLLPPDAISALRDLMKRATLLTPNRDEAALLWGQEITDIPSLERAARDLAATFGSPAVLAKGGHLKTDEAIDILAFPDGRVEYFKVPRIKNVDPHGTGCTYSAAITAMLAKGHSIRSAVSLGKQFITRAIIHRVEIGGYPLLNHLPEAHLELGNDPFLGKDPL